MHTYVPNEKNAYVLNEWSLAEKIKMELGKNRVAWNFNHDKMNFSVTQKMLNFFINWFFM